MTPAELLTDAFGRILETAQAAVDGLSEEELTTRPADDANPIAWLVWHLARVQDDHVADVAGTEQVWTAQLFDERFDLGIEPESIGYGMSTEEVGQVRASAELLVEYLTAVTEATTAYLATVSADDLERVIDEDWDPPVTLGARLVSVVGDDLQHVGQAAYVRGLLNR